MPLRGDTGLVGSQQTARDAGVPQLAAHVGESCHADLVRATSSIYIDAGYLLAASATRVTGTSLRAGVYVDYPALVSGLIRQAEERSGLPILRVHWYDAAHRGVPDQQQERIGELSRVKLRLGRFGMDGQQKGVDLRIGLDLVAHARNLSSDVFFLVSGDDDLSEAVEEAQVHGVQVVLLAVPTADGRAHGVSRHLIRAADELACVPGAVIDSSVLRVESEPRSEESAATEKVGAAKRLAPKPGPPVGGVGPSPATIRSARASVPTSVLAYSAVTGEAGHILPGYDMANNEIDDALVSDVVRRVITSFRKSASVEQVAAVQQGRPAIPRDIDKALLMDTSDATEIYDLPEAARHLVRSRFWEVWDED